MQYLSPALSGTNEARPRNAIHAMINIADVVQVGRAMIDRGYHFGV